MSGKYNWGFSWGSRSIIDATALEYDGNRIKEYLFPTQKNAVCMDEEFKHDFRLHRDRYFLRSMLFGFQRCFGKWGGEMVPEWDREYSQYYFTFLQCYRVKLPSVMIGVCSGMSNFTRHAADREDAAADLRRSWAALGEDDLRSWDSNEMIESLKSDFDDRCVRCLPPDVAQRPEIILANACNNETLLRLLQHECGPGTDLSKLDLAPARRAFDAYVDQGRVDEDDNVNRLVFKMLQYYLSGHPQSANFTQKSYILFALMYIHLYRCDFSRFAGITERVAKWNSIPWTAREDLAARFRKHLSIIRETKARGNKR